ncbi:tryptophan synthase subunit alpha [Methanobacterium spitsbergense]|uniref:Tryptophan synthase alpha chain n=1 Tax=Methanobacterium spitsbergense TaxID=2874285 RepID=A0A8T5UQ12_9EURY|nr:tryptophan synthase subunit alpha [Methanobacterium spitsbergense]MBZ2165734.1 tryptophan synthase subunit alpha [Methanobacterium spitsbergense]
MKFNKNECDCNNKVQSYSDMFHELKNKGEGAFIPFAVAGDPDFDSSIEIVKKYVDNGADALEIGFPFSDPVADGPSVQAADIRSLNSGMTTEKCFEFIRRIRKFTDIPIGLLVYYNLIYKMGIEEFYKNASISGVNGILAADLPPEEAEEVIVAAHKNNIDQIFMVAQTTSNERLAKIVKLCSGFLYVVAVMGVTGARSDIKKSTVDLIKRVRNHTDLPLAVGFGISKPEHVKDVIKSGSDGAIVASAIIDIITENQDNMDLAKDKIGKFCRELKESTIK